MVAFHAQQAIEKTFKAVFENIGSKVPRTHDLINLKSKIEKYHEIIIDFDLLKKINEVYIEARYPSDLGLLPEGNP